MFIKNPKIKFIIDVNQDIKNYVEFNKYCGNPSSLKMFLPKKLFYVLEGDFSKRKKTKIVKEYINNNFNLHKDEISKNVKKIDRRWKLIENKYFKLICKIFKDHPWPKGKYIGFASIFEMYPKNIKEKTFYFSGLKKDLNFNIATIAHEMLHFIFFDYIKTRCGINEGTELKNKNLKYVWNVSEVFNLVIETWKPYQKIFKTNGKPYYFMHKKMLLKMKKLWKEKEDIDYLLNHYF